ncbi:hypothetical protein ACINKY_21165 [Paenibacillus illinoisensis]|uniref:Uncharacterized protein n=1 Tax=Paenibacillus illinoisensis TaxID=59845 RepID=A0ABW8HYE1_9BACL
MEPAILTTTAILTEKAAESAAMQETVQKSLEISHKAAEWNGSAELAPSQETMEKLNGLLDNEKYRKLSEFRELSQTNPDAVQEAYNNVQLKGQMGESLMEAKLSQYGEMRSQIPVQLENAAGGNRIDLQIMESNANLRQIEMNVQGGEITLDRNYDLMKGESASFEVKNGGLPYLRSELLNGELQQQIAAGKQISDHSFVVINENTAKALLQNPDLAAKVITEIEEAGGKLIAGLPSQSVQLAIFMS